jgi:hypothetical protein
MLDYEYIETQGRLGENPLYLMNADLQAWISNELEKRRVHLQETRKDSVAIYLTIRSFRNCPVFVLASPTEEGKSVLEAWSFRMIPPPEDPDRGIQLSLDRVILKQLYPEQFPSENTKPPATQSPTQAEEDDSENWNFLA